MSSPGLVVAVDHDDDQLVHAEVRARDTATLLLPLLGAPTVVCTHQVRDGGAHYVASLAYAGTAPAAAVSAALGAAGVPAAAVVVDGAAAEPAGAGHREHALTAARDHADRSAGRAIDFPGRGGLRGAVPLGALIADSAIEVVQILGGTPADPGLVLQTRDYVRPQYADGRRVLLTRPAGPGELATFEIEFVHQCCAGH